MPPTDRVYTHMEQIGAGMYGQVYMAHNRQTDSLSAIKKIPKDSGTGIPSNALREIALLREYAHPNIVQLQDVVCLRHELHLVFEHIEQDLRCFLDSRASGTPGPIVKSFLNQLLRAVAHCHSNRIMHRDLKPQNVLIDSQGTLKLADFGLARTFSIPARAYTHEVVTRWYRAPEILFAAPTYSSPVDVWSVGCIFAEMVTGNPLWPGPSEIGQIFAIMRTLGSPIRANWPGLRDCKLWQNAFPNFAPRSLFGMMTNLPVDGVKLMMAMFRYNPEIRITAASALEHPYFEELPTPESIADIMKPISEMRRQVVQERLELQERARKAKQEAAAKMKVKLEPTATSNPNRKPVSTAAMESALPVVQQAKLPNRTKAMKTEAPRTTKTRTTAEKPTHRSSTKPASSTSRGTTQLLTRSTSRAKLMVAAARAKSAGMKSARTQSARGKSSITKPSTAKTSQSKQSKRKSSTTKESTTKSGKTKSTTAASSNSKSGVSRRKTNADDTVLRKPQSRQRGKSSATAKASRPKPARSGLKKTSFTAETAKPKKRRASEAKQVPVPKLRRSARFRAAAKKA